MDISKSLVDYKITDVSNTSDVVIPTDVDTLEIQGIGGGGGGGNGYQGAGSQGGGGGGGGSAGFDDVKILTGVSGKTLNIAIGAGGAAGSNGNTTTVSIDGVLVASFPGGKGGQTGVALTYGNGGAWKGETPSTEAKDYDYMGPGAGGSSGKIDNASTISGGDTPGASGGSVGTTTPGFCLGGAGGAGAASPFGPGGAGGNGGVVPTNATNGSNAPSAGAGGGGGGGGWCNIVGGTSPAGSGGAGAGGWLKIKYLRQ